MVGLCIVTSAIVTLLYWIGWSWWWNRNREVILVVAEDERVERYRKALQQIYDIGDDGDIYDAYAMAERALGDELIVSDE